MVAMLPAPREGGVTARPPTGRRAPADGTTRTMSRGGAALAICHRAVAIGGHIGPMQSAESEGLPIDVHVGARRLRVAVVTETYPPEVNGVALTVRAVVEGLLRRDHDVQLVRPRHHALEAAHIGARFHEVLLRGLPIPRYSNLKMGVPSKGELLRLWSVRRPDVVHIATEGPLGWSALRAALQLKLPISSDFRTNFHAYSEHYGIGWLRRPIMAYLRKFHNDAHCTMVPTDALRRDLESHGFRKLCVVARGVDTRRFGPEWRSDELRREWGAGPHDLVVACVGRLAPEKNLGLLIEAFDAISRVSKGAKLVLVGDGPMRAELQARCPGAVLAGQRTGADLAAHYASSDLFLFPSLTETFGNVTIEAMASGLPVLAFAYAAAGQLIRSGTNGVLMPRGDAPGFVGAAVELAANARLRSTLGAQARLSAVQAGWDGVVARFESVLGNVIREAALPEPAPFGVTEHPAA
jgi:glycosyltransferase involved in cell wall biosynthesis